MKNTIILFVGLLLLNYGTINCKDNTKYNPPAELLKGSIDIYCTQDLYNITSLWASEFQRLNPTVKINVLDVSESTISKAANTGSSLRFISEKLYPELKSEPFWEIVVGRDVIVPVINSNNPFINEIYKEGISPDKFAQIFKNPETQNWGTLLKNDQDAPIHYYTIHDEYVDSEIAHFLNLDQIALDGTRVKNEKKLISAIQKDPYAIGFCKLMNIVGSDYQTKIADIKILPIDKNENGKIDHFENIYDDLNAFLRGVWIGKYPTSLYNNIYAISSSKPKNDIEVAFLKWIFTDGQQFLSKSGYCDLVSSERQRKLDALLYNEFATSPVVAANNSNNNYAIARTVLLILVSFILIIFILNRVIRVIKQKKTAIHSAGSSIPLVFDEDSLKIPKGLFFDKSHTWAFMEKNGFVRIGIDDFLQHVTGPLTRIKMKNIGMKIKKGEPIISIIQNGKQIQINAPISGTIKEQNEILFSDSTTLNNSPYNEGWVYLIEPTNWLKEIQFLIMEIKYREWLKNEFTRLKDFIAAFIKPDTLEYQQIILQEGGAISDGFLAEFGPEIWEDFQTNFINTSK